MFDKIADSFKIQDKIAWQRWFLNIFKYWSLFRVVLPKSDHV